MNSKLKLTPDQHAVLNVFVGKKPGTELWTGDIGLALMMDRRYIANYLPARLMGLSKRGFLARWMVGRRASWSLGPMCDLLKEEGLLHDPAQDSAFVYQETKEILIHALEKALEGMKWAEQRMGSDDADHLQEKYVQPVKAAIRDVRMNEIMGG